jgi:polysaccharide biosynthesis transport protein
MEARLDVFRWREIAAALVRRRRLVARVFAVGALTAAAIALLRPPAYNATAKLAIVSERARLVLSPDPKDGSAVEQPTDQDLNAEVALLRSPALIRSVLEKDGAGGDDSSGGLRESLGRAVSLPARLPQEIYRAVHGIDAPSELDGRVEDVASRLSIEGLPRSNLIEISFQDADAPRAAAFINALAAEHVARRAELNQRFRTRSFFETQRELLADKQRQAQQELNAFYDREKIDPTPERRAALRERLTKLELALADAQRELAESRARSTFLDSEVKAQPATVPALSSDSATDPSQIVRARLMELQLQRTALLAQFAPTSGKIADIDRQIEVAKHMLDDAHGGIAGKSANHTRQVLQLDLAQSQAKLAGIEARIAELQSQLDESRPLLKHLDEVAPQAQLLIDEARAAEESLATYRKKEEEARFSDALDASRIVNVALVEPAEVPRAPRAETSALIALFGALLSLLAGLAAGLIRDRLDGSVKSEAEAAQVTGLPILASVRS